MSNLNVILSDLARNAARFRQDQRGNVAMLFGLALVPAIALVGAAVDYTRGSGFRNYIARETDMTALQIAGSDTPNADAAIAELKSRIETEMGAKGSAGNPVKSVTITPSWESGSIYTLNVQVTYATGIISVVPGAPSSMSLGATTAVKRKPAVWNWTLPTIKDLSYEAADYNRISVYCYDESKKAESNKGRRMETLTSIVDNGGSDYSRNAMPACNAGETLSYQLRNVRNMRTTPSKWDDKNSEHYLYYTDTKLDLGTRVSTNTVTGGREAANGTMTLTDLTAAPILETILCDTEAQCKPKSQGGILPNNQETGRTPKTATGGCAEGKFIYYGWEDRPPTSAGASDRDYDDIRIVVSCPTLQKIADKETKIIR